MCTKSCTWLLCILNVECPLSSGSLQYCMAEFAEKNKTALFQNLGKPDVTKGDMDML